MGKKRKAGQKAKYKEAQTLTPPAGMSKSVLAAHNDDDNGWKASAEFDRAVVKNGRWQEFARAGGELFWALITGCYEGNDLARNQLADYADDLGFSDCALAVREHTKCKVAPSRKQA